MGRYLNLGNSGLLAPFCDLCIDRGFVIEIETDVWKIDERPNEHDKCESCSQRADLHIDELRELEWENRYL